MIEEEINLETFEIDFEISSPKLFSFGNGRNRQKEKGQKSRPRPIDKLKTDNHKGNKFHRRL